MSLHNGLGLAERGLDERGLDERGLDERGLDERGLDERTLDERPMVERLGQRQMMAHNDGEVAADACWEGAGSTELDWTDVFLLGDDSYACYDDDCNAGLDVALGLAPPGVDGGAAFANAHPGLVFGTLRPNQHRQPVSQSQSQSQSQSHSQCSVSASPSPLPRSRPRPQLGHGDEGDDDSHGREAALQDVSLQASLQGALQGSLQGSFQVSRQASFQAFAGPVPRADVELVTAAHEQEKPAMAEFFTKNNAWRPPHPCSHCRRLRLQCFMLQTTSANPNPVNSCSSCVALFRQCSLAERSKRQPSQFETSSPVIGQLHGVNEECHDGQDYYEGQGYDGQRGYDCQQGYDGRQGCNLQQGYNGQDYDDGANQAAAAPAAATAMATTNKRASSRSVRKTQVLRDWFACNLHHPYPTDQDKTMLSLESGLSRTQVVNWFTNARRRHRLTTQPMINNVVAFRTGSPMPRSLLSSMTPMERWRNSPPETEHISASAIQHALDTGVVADVARSSASGDSSCHAASMQNCSNYSSEGSASSAHSHLSAQSDATALSGLSLGDWTQASWTAKTRRCKPRHFPCRHCPRTFSKKYDWIRHERCLHDAGDVSWICALPLRPNQPFVVWRLGQEQPECILCGKTSPTAEHVHSHEFEACSRRSVQHRSFSRKDHLWQHLYKFHGCRKWEGWKPDLSMLQHTA